MGRQPNRRPSIYTGADGWMHTYVTVGKRPDGKLDRRHIRGRTKAEVADKVERLTAKLRQGHVPEVGAQPTVGAWLEHWLTTIAARKCRASTLEGYASKIRHRLIPGIGYHRLDRLTAEHIEAYFAELEAEVAPAHARQIFRILSRALKVAYQRGKITHNPCGQVDPPSVPDEEIEPPTLEETQAILAAAQDRCPARWWVALGLGLRQGEVLGLRWADVDLDAAVPVLAVRETLGRRKWRHGCTDPGVCAKRKCKTKPCREACTRHKRDCPLPCPPDCTAHASTCPERKGGGLVFGDPKSRKGKRTIPLPPPLPQVLRQHQLEQERVRDTAARWAELGLVFCQDNGKPINPRTDWGQWKQLLRAAGVGDYRLHDARHGAATTWLATGVEPRVAMELLGHSQISLTQRYTHVRPEYLKAAAERIGGALELLQPDGATTRHLRAVK
jgi:integrase